MRNFYLMLLIMLVLIGTANAQKEAYNWDYGGPYVITFDTPDGEPAILKVSVMPYLLEGVSSISDSFGNFLFSTEGEYVYSYIGNPFLMKYSDGINPPQDTIMHGCFSTTQSTVIIKQPGSKTKYYVFTAGCFLGQYSNFELGYNYSVIDLSKNDSKGEITEINSLLYAPSTEKLVAIRHANGKDIWIITHRLKSKMFEVFLLTEKGLDIKNSIKNSVGFYHDLKSDYAGYLKSNLKGNILANVALGSNQLDILKFDNLTGKISLLVNLQLVEKLGIEYLPYGVEFSPDNNKLYITGESNSNSKFGLIQLDISKLDKDSILNSIKNINLSAYAGLQIAPNGKIYIANGTGDRIGVIKKPNLNGDSCDFSIKGTKFISARNHGGLPNFVAGIFDFDVKIVADTVCEGEELVLTAQATPDITVNQYTWTLPDGSEMTGKTIKIPNANESHNGLYKVKVDINSTLRYDSVYIEVHPLPIAIITGNLSFCKNGSTTLTAYQDLTYKYKWSTGDTTASIIVKKEGKYILTIENEFGCIAVDSVYVSYSEDLEFALLGETKLCLGDTLLLSTDLQGSNYIYDWSTGETTPSLLVTKGGKYILKVKSEAGCEGIDSIIIEEFESPEVKFEKAQYTICKGDDFILKPIETNSEYEYIWSDGQTGVERTFEESAELYLIAKSQNGCTDTAFVKVEVLEMPVASILADKTEVCFGEKITLKAENYKPEFDYKWSNGEETESISISTSGVYRLIITNKNQCSDTAEIEVKVHPDLALELKADNTNLCFSDSTRIYPKAKYAQYLWSTGEITESITVHEAGVYSLIVKNEFGCSDSAEIEISKFNANVTFDKEKLEFDELCLGDSQTQNMKMTIETNSDFVVNRIHTTSNNFNVINSNSYLKTYKNGDAVDLEIMFEPNDAEEFFDTLFVESEEPCIYKAAIPIYGSSKALFRFALPVIETEVAKRIEIPVNSALICPNAEKLTTDYEITISVDKAYFQADSVKFGDIIDNKIVGNDRILKIKASAEFEKLSGDLNPVNIIYGQALIGRSETVPLTIQNVDFPNNRYFSEYQNGSLKIDGCVNDLSGIQIFKPTTMKVAPNPADGDLKVTVGTQEEGSFSIIIYDFQGREVLKSEFKRNNRVYEENDYLFNISGLGTGVYSVHLTAPWTLKRERLLIVK